MTHFGIWFSEVMGLEIAARENDRKQTTRTSAVVWSARFALTWVRQGLGKVRRICILGGLKIVPVEPVFVYLV